MDDEWKKIYEENSVKDLPIHAMSCWTKEGFEELFKVTFSIVKKLRRVEYVLDVGCGSGVYCAEFDRRGFNVIGVDYAEGVINRAKAHHPDLKFSVASAYNLPFNDDEFDLVTCIGVLQCVYDAEKVVEELTRVSKKYVVVSTLLRKTKLDNPLRFLEKKLEKDSWPTRDYHPSELEDLFEKHGFMVNTILKHNDKFIQDGFFIVATKLD